MMKDSLSPEEKLLRIIKGDKPPKPANIQAQEISVHKTAPPQAPGLKPALAVRQYLTFENAKRLLPVFFILSFIYLIASFSYPWVGLKKITLPIVTTQEARDLKTESREEPKPYEFYLEGVRQRRIFGNILVQQAGIANAAANADLIKKINLVGIIAGENPQAIIEDKDARKTYSVTKGQAIGEFRVEDIQEGKIILEYRGQRYELSI